jgi:hypothetical protein
VRRSCANEDSCAAEHTDSLSNTRSNHDDSRIWAAEKRHPLLRNLRARLKIFLLADYTPLSYFVNSGVGARPSEIHNRSLIAVLKEHHVATDAG